MSQKNEPVEIRFKPLDPNAIVPKMGTKGSACFDLFALEDTHFKPGEIALVRTGWACSVPEGYRTNLYVRSSTPLKKGFILANSVGIIDNDYRGELLIQLMNVKVQQSYSQSVTHTHIMDTAYFIWNEIKAGDKIAQLEIVPQVSTESFATIVSELDDTERGEGGFGSTDEVRKDW